MGVKNLPLIIEKLIEHGLNKSTPVAVIQNGCQPLQHTVSGTLSNITAKVKKEKIKPPSIIVIGDVVRLRDKINWFETKPLFGRSIIVTRSREQASKLVSKLNGLGANVIEIPAIKIAPPEATGIIHECINKIDTYNWIIFTSVNGVSYFYRYLFELGFDSRKMFSAKICAIGTATSEKLMEYGIKPDLVPGKFISDEILRELAEKDEIKDKSFLLPRADIAPEKLAKKLINNGAKLVDDISLYKTVEHELDNQSQLYELLRKKNFDMVTFTSSSTVRNFEKILKKSGTMISTDKTNAEIKCAAIGPITAETARHLGFNVEVIAETHTIDGLVEALGNYFL